MWVSKMARPMYFGVLVLLRLADAQENFCTREYLSHFEGFPMRLDSSVYWFGPNDQSEKATGSASRFYDPNKPTMLYFHGWTGQGNGWTSKCKRLTTRCHSDVCPDGGGQLLVNDWLDEGWNVGFFYWDQFADEECARDAEQKLWFDRGGDGLAWKSYNPATGQTQFNSYAKSDEMTVSDICVNQVKRAMGSYKGSQVRFVGHSLGAQLAVRCASLLHVEDHPAAPSRLALLEPYFSKHSHMFFGCHGGVTTDEGMGDFATRLTVQMVEHLWSSKKVVTETYKSSLLTEKSAEESPYSELKSLVENGMGGVEKTLVGTLASGMKAEDLERASTLVKYEPEWCGGVGANEYGDVEHVACRHSAVVPMYLMSYGRAPPPQTPLPAEKAAPGSALGSCMTPSAACTDDQLRQWVQRQLDMAPTRQMWDQSFGQNTFANIDDAYILDPSIKQGFQLGLRSANSLVQETPVEYIQTKQSFSMLTFLRTPHLWLPVVAAVFLIVTIAVVWSHYPLRPGDDSDDESLSPKSSRRTRGTSRTSPSRNSKESQSPATFKDPELGQAGYDPLLASMASIPTSSNPGSFNSQGSRVVLTMPMQPRPLPMQHMHMPNSVVSLQSLYRTPK